MGCYCGSALASFVNLRTAFKIVDRDALLVKLRAMSASDDFFLFAVLSFGGVREDERVRALCAR